MMLTVVISSIFALLYAMLMLLYRKGWVEQPEFAIQQGFEPTVRMSIIIPARNEEVNIGKCLDSIISQDYPSHLFEIIVVDDHSIDNTAFVVSAYNKSNIRYLKLADHPDTGSSAFKKKALALGIANSTGELIVTTDADCSMKNKWLVHIAALYQKVEPVMIIAPVDFICSSRLVEIFQSLDFMSMQGITAASYKLGLGNMSNGANLAFTRKAYEAVGGYTGIDHLASGDDYLLMMKLKKEYPYQISYLKNEEAIVHTLPQSTWGSFLQQRIRWASKSGKYNDTILTIILLLVYIFNLSLVIISIMAFFNSWLWIMVLVMLLVKTEAEMYYLYPVSVFFKKRSQLFIFPLLQPVHIFYVVLAGLLGFIGVYTWKGRTVR